MNDIFFDHQPQTPKKPSFLPYVAVALISSVVGGMVAVWGVTGLTPEQLKNSTSGVMVNQVAKAESTDSAKPVAVDYKGVEPTVAIAEQVGPAVVGIINKGNYYRFSTMVEQGSGSGVIIDKAGYIVTNAHVIEGAKEVEVSLNDGRNVSAKIIGVDSKTDLAVLKIEADNLVVASLGDSSKLKVGELAIAIGNPLGEKFAGSVTTGVISALNRNLLIGEKTMQVIQTDAAINPGNSGGALVNSKGQVVGINSAKIAIEGVEGMGFSIPINDARPIINELIQYGYVSRPWIGIEGATIDDETAAYYKLPKGVYVTKVVNFGPASQAGLRAGDVITKIGDQDIKDMDGVLNILNRKRPKDKLDVVIVRDGNKMTVNLQLGEYTDSSRQ